MAFPGEEAAPAAVEQTPVQEENQEQVVENKEKAPEAEAKEKAASTKEEKKEIQKQLKKFKYKADGEEVEEELDLNDEKELSKRLSLAKAAQKRMAESAQLRKGLEQFIEVLKSNPRAILSHPDIGVDVKEFAKKILEEDLQEQQKSPEQKEKERLEKELQELKDKYENEKKEKEKQEFERLQAEQEEKITNDIQTALAEVKLPPSPRAIKYMAEYMSLALENGIDVSAKEVAPLVLQKMRDDYRELLRTAPDELLEQFIDKDTEARLQKKRVSKHKQAVENTGKIKVPAEEKKSDVEVKKVSIDKFLYG